MANIKIDNLQSTGSALLTDPESYLTELNQDELNIQGGITPSWITITIILAGSCTAAANGKKDPREVR